MKKFYILTLAALILSSGYVFGQKEAQHQKDAERAKKVDTRIDNNGYWKKMAALGLARLNPVTPVKPAVYVGSEIRAFSVITDDSPDVAVATSSSTQSENSVFVHPDDNLVVINSNNSTPNPSDGSIYGANWLGTEDGGLNWSGTVQGAGGYNWGDPVALIGLDGAYYVGAITSSFGQSVAKSTNQGGYFTVYNVANAGGEGLDKNHLWVDNSLISPYSNYLYDAWTDFGGFADGNIALSRSINGAVNWSTPVNVSSAVNAGSHCQGVNINTGPNGEVYVIWAIYDGWPTDETAIGLARSFNGGATFEPATRIIQNIRGIRATGVNKNMRNNSFPSMACDISGNEYNGNIYIVWSNVGVPGINSGNDVDVYMSRSEDLGVTWSTPVRVNQDPVGQGSKHYFPWITCDPENGMLSVVFYDDRNVGGYQCEVYCANSSDGGETWEDFKVSDVAFTPSPIPNMADGYMGDYLGISARGGWVYPAWADNRTGSAMTYVSPYETNPLSKPTNLTAEVTFETGITDLQWRFDEMPDFSYFKIYRGVDSIGITYDTVYNDQLPDYGIYLYKVTAKYSDGSESSSSNASVQWGDAQISVNPLEIEETLQPDSSVTRMVTISNIGQLEMSYNISMFIPSDASVDARAYCGATGGCDEYISRVQLNEIDNLSNCTNYGNYTNLSTTMSVGSSYQITVTNGTPIYSEDQCGLWIDWNQNEVFDDNESIPMNGSPGVGPYTATISPPVGAMPGETRLRTRIVYYQSPIPCGALTYGEVEDYTVNVSSWLFADPVSGNIPAGENMEIAVTLNAVNMALGTYTAELNVFSNDPDDPEITVPITMHVAEVAVIVSADQETICLGESVQLTSEVIGGSGTFTYTWTSDPAGFTSGEANVTVTPDVTTTYFLEVFDGFLTFGDQITIQVNPLPSVYIGADTAICQGESLVISAGEGFASYLWNTSETTTSIETAVEGAYWVEVTNEFGCARLDTLYLIVTQFPVKPVISSGPATVDNYNATSSTYSCAEDPYVTTFQWSVTPSEAGTTSSTGTNGEFAWTAGYTGSVLITVMGLNDCGNSEFSDAFATEIYSSAGLNEISTDRQLIIYPNPADGKVTVRLPSQKTFTGDLTVTDAEGSTVYSQTGVTITAGDNVTLDLGQLSEGVYSLKLSSQSVVYYGRIIMK
ncbi:MAG: GEVED domain-containing protein [Bacteroidales bacterium]|nr:GEVED domain-containing protein [Bacteroidales bacterium]